ncbi:bifunctional diguanylate cyclase/phosphodiesterase [Salinibacillus xinjiangensis]|uniref:EAL domain-containing protein n=1 Tax=Salinibacillus xinjiangensis TaxID=1229268 RepID=A0A6G1X421_9BACI|nr:GGDEF domain-containing phosphodiesterase [Salinibacillus xinjiangensis]MRG85669.1 EAL domain-containing protein [Salinibacillus xinjiangensis]
MNTYLKQIPLLVWLISGIILGLSIYFHLLETATNIGLFWILNLLSVTLFSYYLGLLGGLFALIVILTVRISVDLQTFSELSFHEWASALIINSIGFVTSISIGYFAGKLKSNETKIYQILNNNDITYWTRDLKTNKVTVSEGSAKIYGLSRKEFDKNPSLWFDSIHPKDKQISLHAMKKQELGKRTKEVYRIFRQDGDIRWVEDRGTPSVNKKGEVTKVDGVIFDITSQKLAEEQMNKMAYHDFLTGLPNRNGFSHYVNESILTAKQTGTSLAVLFIDFDNFKRVNDTLGHNAGDKLLVQIANRLHDCIRDHDVVSRQGGDEFIVLLENTYEETVGEIAERIIENMNKPYFVNGNEIFSTPSIGISIYPSSGDNAETLIEKADFAMYLAKERGKNNYQFYNDDLNQKLKRRLTIETRLYKAIDNRELSVHYHPQINLETGQLAGAEALLRWKTDIGPISPGEFIPIAEETGHIINIGEWVIRQSCRDIKQFRKRGLSRFPISVNISTKQLMHPHFIIRLKNIIHEEEIDPSLLTLEITESTLLFYEDAKENIIELRELGVGISLDDFGVGYSSLSMIKNIEIDELKIDQSFLIDALENKRVYSLLETIIEIGKKLDAKVVVEGVETAEQLELLLDKGVYGQGYFYTKPLSMHEFESWYDRFYKREERV